MRMGEELSELILSMFDEGSPRERAFLWRLALGTAIVALIGLFRLGVWIGEWLVG